VISFSKTCAVIEDNLCFKIAKKIMIHSKL